MESLLIMEFIFIIIAWLISGVCLGIGFIIGTVIAVLITLHVFMIKPLKDTKYLNKCVKANTNGKKRSSKHGKIN